MRQYAAGAALPFLRFSFAVEGIVGNDVDGCAVADAIWSRWSLMTRGSGFAVETTSYHRISALMADSWLGVSRCRGGRGYTAFKSCSRGNVSAHLRIFQLRLRLSLSAGVWLC